MKFSIIFGIAAMGLFLGCEKQNTVKSGTGHNKGLAEDTVVLKVDGKTLTQKDWDAYTNLRVAFYRLMKDPKKASQGPLGKDYDINRDLERVKKTTKESCMPLFIQSVYDMGNGSDMPSPVPPPMTLTSPPSEIPPVSIT